MSLRPAYPDRIRNRTDLGLFLDLDLQAHGLSRWTFAQWLARPEIRFQRALRRAEWSRTLGGVGKIIYAWHRVRLQHLSVLTGISIPLNVFGPGLSIAHYGSIVVNNHAKVGSFCRIHSATNIGTHQGAAPTIGDFVYIGPGAVIYGSVVIGDRAVIGANSVVAKDVPADSTAVGAPAKVLPDRDSRSVMPLWIQASMTDGKVDRE